MKPVGILRSPHQDKLGTPRQPRLTGSVGTLEVRPPEVVRGLEAFSHVWLLFLFDRNPEGAWRPTVRPPRLGGQARMGVFATRSPFRPNPIGLSAVRLIRIEQDTQRAVLHLEGVDLVDGTPVLDIKPYVPWSDSIPEATTGWAPAELPELPVDASAAPSELQSLLVEVLRMDPRPAWARTKHPTGSGRPWKMRIADHEVAWEVSDGTVRVTSAAPIGSDQSA